MDINKVEKGKGNSKILIMLLITIMYLAIIILFIIIDAQGMKTLKPNEWGDFFAGFFAPLVFLWLIFGYYQQGKELEQNTKALNLQAEELRRSVEQQKSLASTTEQELEHLKQQSAIELDIMLTNAQPFFHFTLNDAIKHDLKENKNTLISPKDELYKKFEFLLFEITFTNSRTIARELQLEVESEGEIRCKKLYSIIDNMERKITFTIKNKTGKTDYLPDDNINITFSYFDNLDLLQEQKFKLLLKNKNEPHLVEVKLLREPRNFRKF